MSTADPASPTFLCRTWAALRLLQNGQTEAAEDELAAAFGLRNERIKKDGRLLAKMTIPNGLTPAEELEFYTRCQAIVAAGRKPPEGA